MRRKITPDRPGGSDAVKDKDNSDEPKSGPNNSEPQPIVTENGRPTPSQNAVENNKAKPQNREPRALIIWTAILALGTVALGCAAIRNEGLCTSVRSV
jgi:hypothetical protein